MRLSLQNGEWEIMKQKNRLTAVIAGVLALLLTACAGASPAAQEPSPAAEEPAPTLGRTSGTEDAAYAGYQFSGADPWGGALTVTVTDITDGEMDWTFTDSFEDHTLYQVQRKTAIQDETAAFDIQGKDVEHEGVSFVYQGMLVLKDGKLTVIFDSGAVTDGASAYHDAAALADGANQAVLDKTADGPYMPYTVQSGDSVHSIAKAHGISTKDLCILNQIVIIETAKAHGYEFADVTEYAKYLFPGEELLVPKQ